MTPVDAILTVVFIVAWICVGSGFGAYYMHKAFGPVVDTAEMILWIIYVAICGILGPLGALVAWFCYRFLNPNDRMT
jgi:hypothetical protein